MISGVLLLGRIDFRVVVRLQHVRSSQEKRIGEIAKSSSLKATVGGLSGYLGFMIPRDTLLDLLRDIKAELVQRYPVERLALFGSYARGEQTESSDCDLLVEFSRPVGMEFIRLAEELEERLGLKVDLVSAGGIKPRYYQAIQGDLIDV
jgi:predicted nucleotidyltransferase